jgi:NAD(P)-dependent dehydrogenase (short-subunit alcohol dehydrogenase family)
MKKVWFITGSSRGLGRSLAAAVLKHGDLLAATSRRPDDLKDLKQQYGDQVLTIGLDVVDRQQIRKAIEKTIETFGHIDVLVNNAGFGITGAAEGYTDEQVKSQLDVNLYAPIEVTRQVLPFMRKQKSGRILQISSIGGRVNNAGLSIYQAAKSGLCGFSESLSKEVAGLGIKVTSIEPGGFRTDWAGASMTFAPEVEGYENTVGGITKFLTSGKFIPMGDPDKAAKVMIDLVDHPEPPVHLVLGSEAVGILRTTDADRTAEFEKWIPVSVSTDHDNAENFMDSEEGQKYLAIKGIKI